MDASEIACFGAAMRAADETFLVFAGMRNEGPFIVEWVCWYRMLGFDVLVATNDCTDRSPALLDRLAEEGWLTHAPHVVPDGMRPKGSAYRTGRDHPLTATADWVLVCDVDEFLVLHSADTIQEFIGDGDRDFLGIAFNWKVFGTGGWKTYRDGLVHRQFRRCAGSGMKVNGPFKSMFRRPRDFLKWGDHTPYKFTGAWGQDGNHWVDCEGRVLTRFNDPAQHPIRHLSREQISHRTAQMNHYIIRSDESFDLKRGRPSATAGKDRYTETFYRTKNRNGSKDTSALRFEAEFDRLHAEAMALPDVKRLHHLCCADYVAELCAHQGRTAEDDPRWRHHMRVAERA